jgi:diaminopimelate decarboxylase
VLNEDDLEFGISKFKQALNRNFSNNIIGYSVKTNSLPYVLYKVRECGCFAEVVSSDEYELAKTLGFPINKIVYNGPMKTKDTFLEAIQNGAYVNIETHREIQWLNDLPQNTTFNVGLRLNINVSAISADDAKHDDDYSRFGFTDETSDFENAVKQISKLSNVCLAGLHIHRMSATRSCRYYTNLLKYAMSVVCKYKLTLNYVDVGGGYFGIFPNAPTFEDYSDAIRLGLGDKFDKNLTIIVEPGTALIAQPMKYFASVIDVKHLRKSTIVATDGTRNDVDPLFTKSNYLKEIIYNHTSEDIIPEQIISGSSCMENDKLFSLTDERELSVGDVIQFNNVGSYTMCLSPMFINYFPRVYAIKGKHYKLVREKWDAADYISKTRL